MCSGYHKLKVFSLGLLGLLFIVTGCGKNDGIRTAGGYYSPQSPSVNPPGGGGFPGPITSNPFPSNPSFNGGFGGGGTFQPYLPSGFGNGFYPWMPIYGYYQQNVNLRPVFVALWNGWQNYACANHVSVYDFTAFWYNYCPQVMSQPLYQYFSSQFYPWMTPSAVFYTSVNPQIFWQNYSGRPY